MFSSKVGNYILFFITAAVIGFVSSKFIPEYKKSDDYEVIKKYILNESPLYGYNRPKIWIHSKYEINARKWRDFHSRNTTDLNQPYLHLTIKTIINHCGNDFNICLVDDDTFSKIIPEWNIDLHTIPEPFRTHYREVGLLQLIYHYGGMIVPNSFLCLKNLTDFYAEGIREKKPFACEMICRSVNQFHQKKKLLFSPDTSFMGCLKHDIIIRDFIEYLREINQRPHFERERDFLGNSSHYCMMEIEEDKMNLVDGKKIGVKNDVGKPILLEDLVEEEYLDLSDDCVGIYIPAEEVLNRTKFEWLAAISSEELLNTRSILAKYLKASLIDANDDTKQSTEIRSVVTI